MSQRKLLYVACVLLILFVLGASPGSTPTEVAAKATVSSCGGWSIVKSPNPQNDNILTAVSVVSASDIWAVGNDYYSPGLTVIEHWNGTQWKVVPSPNVRKEENELYAVAAVSTNDVWAVGDHYPSRGFHKTLIEHWNGTKWSIVSSPSPGEYENDLYGIAAVSASDVWAVGSHSANTNGPTLVEHWNGKTWSVVSSPNVGDGNYLTGLVAVSANDVWAVGYYFFVSNGLYQTLVEHWNGTKWSVVSSPNPDMYGNALSGVSAASGSDVWAVGVGYDSNGIPSQPLIEHWNGTKWSVEPGPGSGRASILTAVAAISASDVWTVGYSYDSRQFSYALTEHWNGTAWQIIKSPDVSGYLNYLSAVAVVTSSDVWVVGNYDNNDIFYQTLIEHYC